MSGERPAPNVPVEAVLFDFDSTLTKPGHLDFSVIRAAIGCPAESSILTYIDGIKEPTAKAKAWAILDELEIDAARKSEEDPDAARVVAFCRKRGLRLGIVTRNSRRSIMESFTAFTRLSAEDFDVIVTRDDPVAAKPDPASVQFACERIGVVPARAIVVGDYIYDIEAGRSAGARTVFYDSDPSRLFARPESDHSIGRLGELTLIISLYLPLPSGKLPNELLKVLIEGLAGRAAWAGAVRGGVGGAAEAVLEGAPQGAEGSAVLVGPGVGEDVAVVVPPWGDEASRSEEAGGELLLLKSDPITIVSLDIARYLLTVNANDIATVGGRPWWFLATVLAPPGTLPAEIGGLLRDIDAACAEAGMLLCGGHTEVTDGVARTVVCGTTVGSVSRLGYVDKRSARSGDLLYLSKALAVEGSCILATHCADRLLSLGMSPASLETAAGRARIMSIVPEARAAVEAGAASAMHDVTEGGLATALRELSEATGRRLCVELERIPVYPETREMARLLAFDPLGLIASGSLLMCVRPESAAALERVLEEAGIAATQIGAVGGEGSGVDARSGGSAVELPSFDADEITRLLAANPEGTPGPHQKSGS
ncbi:MAG TPA: HAD-IA family hydrolase [Spirochaetia bacterium]|nr:HAD-IA family hydrolase [Spirochaetia bacterium]